MNEKMTDEKTGPDISWIAAIIAGLGVAVPTGIFIWYWMTGSN